MEKWKKYLLGWGIIALIFFSFYIYSNYNGKRRKNLIINNYAFCDGKFTKRGVEKGKGTIGYYEYYVNGINYRSGSTDVRYWNFGNTLFDSSFPIIYSKLNPEMCNILVFPDDFEFFDLKFPDNLKWVLKYNH